MLRPPFILGGVQFDLGHLAPTQMLCPRVGANGPDLVIDVRFNHHAYTVAAPGIPATAGAPHVSERGDVRLFDLVRWQQSRDHLPGMVASLPTARVEFTPEKRNYRYALRNRLVDGQEYALFLSLRRSGMAGYDLHMTVESAYAVPAGSRGRPPGEIRFGVLAMKTVRGEVISFPPRRYNEEGLPEGSPYCLEVGKSLGTRLGFRPIPHRAWTRCQVGKRCRRQARLSRSVAC